MKRRTARLGNSVITLEYDETDPVGQRIVETVLPGHMDDLEAAVTHSLETRSESERLVLRRGEKLLYDGHSAGQAAGILLDELTRALITDCRDGMVFHAAALVHGQFAVILPGPSGTGKTTLAAWLTTRGLTYLNDEVVLVDPAGDKVQWFARPLAVKSDGMSLLRRWIDQDDAIEQSLTSSVSTLINPALLGSTKSVSSYPLSAVVFPSRQKGAPSVRPLSSAETALGLIGCLVNASNLPNGGFPDVARLAARVRGCRLLYEDLEDLPDGLLTAWLASASRRAASVRASPCS